MELNGVVIHSAAHSHEVSTVVCGQLGHLISLFNDGKYLCTKCGLSLDEIRGQKEMLGKNQAAFAS